MLQLCSKVDLLALKNKGTIRVKGGGNPRA